MIEASRTYICTTLTVAAPESGHIKHLFRRDKIPQWSSLLT
jgi:hypothetical protein